MRSVPLIGRPAAVSPRTVAAPRRRKKATARSTRPKTSSPMATPGCERGLREQVGTRSWAPSGGPLSERRFLLRPRADVAQLFAARDALLGDEPFEHQLAGRHHRGGIFLAGEPRPIEHTSEHHEHDPPTSPLAREKTNKEHTLELQ